MQLTRNIMMRLGILMIRRSFRMELRCCRMGVFFYLNPRRDSMTFINQIIIQIFQKLDYLFDGEYNLVTTFGQLMCNRAFIIYFFVQKISQVNQQQFINIHNYKSQMIARIFRVTTLAKKNLLINRFGAHSQSIGVLVNRNKYLFSNDQKPGPIHQHKPITIKKGEQSIDAQMKPGSNDRKEENLKAQQKGLEPSNFGNTMLLISALALVLAYAYMEIQVIRASKKNKPEGRTLNKVTGVGKAQIGGDWQLIGTDGKPFSSKNLQGKYYLIYFGFTHCPDICPNSLTKLSRAIAKVKKSKEANFFDLKTVFVSVDPDRDSGEKIKKFISLFDPQMIGVTGTNNQDPALRECMKRFKIYASKLQFEEENQQVKGRKSYTIDHTILTYLISDTNQYLTHLGANLGEQDLATLILQKISQDKRQKMKNLNL